MVCEILQGDCITVLKEGMKPESVDTFYACPSPFQFYNDENEKKIGSEVKLNDYISNIMNLVMCSHEILKPSGSFFLQIPENFNKIGGVFGMPVIIENKLRNLGLFFLINRLFWHRIEKKPLKNYRERGFLKNYEYIFHLVKDYNEFYFNEKSKYAKTSVFSYPLEDSYYTNEFDSGLPTELSKMVIDTTVREGVGTICDPLCGSAKVGVVAKKMNRNFIGIEIDHEIAELAKIRLGIDNQ